MLTVTLSGLERDDLVTRTVHPIVPPRVDYSLTDLGHNLSATTTDLVQWAEHNRPHIDNARKPTTNEKQPNRTRPRPTESANSCRRIQGGCRQVI